MLPDFKCIVEHPRSTMYRLPLHAPWLNILQQQCAAVI